MKKLILTSPQFSGEVELLYDSEKMLVLIDMQNAQLTELQRRYMKNNAPVYFEDVPAVQAAFKSDTLHVAEASYKITFIMFWDKYGLKRNKDRCEKLWDKLSEANRIKAYAGLNTYFRHLALNSWKTKADPETYLRKEYWLNEYH